MRLGRASKMSPWPHRISDLLWEKFGLREPSPKEVSERFDCNELRSTLGLGRTAIARIAETLRDNDLSFKCGCDGTGAWCPRTVESSAENG